MFGLDISKEELRRLGKRNFFCIDRRISLVKKDREPVHAKKQIVQRILELPPDKYLVIPPVVPEQFESRTAFLKHAEEVALPNKTLDELKQLRPIDLVREAYRSVDGNYYAGISFHSYLLTSRMEEVTGFVTRISLVAMLGGDRLFTYAELSPFTQIDVKPYTDTSAVETRGGKFVVELPSRTPNKPRYQITYEGVPMAKCRLNHLLWSNMMTNHTCPTKINDFSYRHGSKIEWDEHDVAGYLAAAAHLAEEGDVAAVNYSPVMRPTQFIVDFSRKMLEQLIVEEADKEGKKSRRRANRAECELFLQNCTIQQGVDKCWEPLTKEMILRQYV
ncbi:MAG: hypothetical protein KJ574_04070 [Nanoarchaeota archaeon]|nr:hypothetical protein [Nanoarchaeota archaeon]